MLLSRVGVKSQVGEKPGIGKASGKLSMHHPQPAVQPNPARRSTSTSRPDELSRHYPADLSPLHSG